MVSVISVVMKSKPVIVLSFLVTLAYGQENNGTPLEITLTQGKVRGYKEPGNNYFGFYGIPYAKAPVGIDRFKAPLKAPTWKDTFEATEKDILCPQTTTMRVNLLKQKKKPVQKEDCLIANVYVPDSDKKKLPVVIYIHGGAFQLGFGNMMIHDPLLESGEIIEVTFNYRLGANGFLCLGTENAPGNAGMKDQVALLKWVKNNIAAFGGNPDDITLAGYSSGAASVELLMLSKSSQGLFHKAIIESGSALSVWAIQTDPIAMARDYARIHNYDGADDDVQALENFYKGIELTRLQIDPFSNRMNSTFGFVPCIEKNPNEDSFLTETPLDIIKSGKYTPVPTLIGFGNTEGIFRLPFFEDWQVKMNEDFSNVMPVDLDFGEDTEWVQKIKEYYFKDKAVSIYTLIKFVEYFGDIMFAYPILRSVNLHLESGSDSIYLYQYSYVDENRRLPYNVYGADHCSQSLAISKNMFVKEDSTEAESYAVVKKLLTKLWINFIVSGKPVPEEMEEFPSDWPAISSDNPVYIEFEDKPHLRRDLLKERYDFWDEIYSKYYKRPEAPSISEVPHSEL